MWIAGATFDEGVAREDAPEERTSSGIVYQDGRLPCAVCCAGAAGPGVHRVTGTSSTDHTAHGRSSQVVLVSGHCLTDSAPVRLYHTGTGTTGTTGTGCMTQAQTRHAP